MYIVEQGIADLDAVDLVLKYGPGSRFQVMAPFEHMDMVGLDLITAVESYLWPHLADAHEIFPMVTEKVARGELGFKSERGGLPLVDPWGADGPPRAVAGQPGPADGHERLGTTDKFVRKILIHSPDLLPRRGLQSPRACRYTACRITTRRGTDSW